MKEIDLIAEENGVLHPVEIKKRASRIANCCARFPF